MSNNTFSVQLARVKEENAAQLATITRQDWRIKDRSIQMTFRDSEQQTQIMTLVNKARRGK